jgi:hypothetical protein
LYIEGWEVGFYDALKFFRMRADGALAKVAGEGGDKIGCRNGFWSLEREENLFRSGNKVSEVELGRFVIVLGYEWSYGIVMMDSDLKDEINECSKIG